MHQKGIRRSKNASLKPTESLTRKRRYLKNLVKTLKNLRKKRSQKLFLGLQNGKMSLEPVRNSKYIKERHQPWGMTLRTEYLPLEDRHFRHTLSDLHGSDSTYVFSDSAEVDDHTTGLPQLDEKPFYYAVNNSKREELLKGPLVKG